MAAELEAFTARQWRRALLWTLPVAYVVALVTCFVVNLSVDHTLSWFYVVLAAVATGFCVTTLPLLVSSRHRVTVTSGAFVLAVTALLTACWVQTGGGRWWGITVASVLYGSLVVLLPFVLHEARLPAPWYRHRTIICLAADTVGLLVLLRAVVDREYFASTALPVALFSLPWVWAVVAVVRYLRVDLRTRVATTVVIVSLYGLLAEPVIRWIATGTTRGQDLADTVVYAAWVVVALLYLGIVRARARREADEPAPPPATTATEQRPAAPV